MIKVYRFETGEKAMALMPQPGSKLKTSTTKRPDAAFEN
jgi:hypothetical protein